MIPPSSSRKSTRRLTKAERIRRHVLSEWRRCGLMLDPDDENQTTIAGALPGVLKSLGLGERIQEGDILAAWKEVVGEFIAQNSKPTKLKNKILFVRVLQPSVHCVLEQEFKPVILQKLKKRFGAGSVRSIRFSLG